MVRPSYPGTVIFHGLKIVPYLIIWYTAYSSVLTSLNLHFQIVVMDDSRERKSGECID
jgi:hypothetical protein